MALLDLPNEIIIQVAGFLYAARDISSMSRVNRRMFGVLNSLLYRYNIKKQRSNALFWAVQHRNDSTVRKMIHFGADINVQIGSMKGIAGSRLTALHVAAWKGHLAIVKVLLDVGADPEAKIPEGFTPLYFALTQRHVKVARTISRRIVNLQTCLVDPVRLLTPLHVSAYLGLTECVRFFLNAGVDVDARDYKSMTPLYHTLMQDNPLELFSSRSRAFGYARLEYTGLGYIWTPATKDLLKTAEVLLEFQADPDIEVPSELPTLEPTTARQIGLLHWCDRFGALLRDDETFQDDFDQSSDVQIGRPWMPPPFQKSCQGETNERTLADEINADDFPATNHHTPANTEPVFQFSSTAFPSLGAGQAPASGHKIPASRGRWSRSRPYSEQFPPLGDQNSNASLEPKSGPAQPYSEKTKDLKVTGKPLSVTEMSMPESSQSASRRGKAGKKPRWQPVKM